MAIITTSARDLSGFNVEGEDERLVPRKTVFNVASVINGYHWLRETAMRQVKPNRQFATREEALDAARRAGFTADEIQALLAATTRAAAKRTAWEAAGRPGEARMRERLQRQTDLQCYGVPGYARNDLIERELAARFGPRGKG